MDAKETHIYIAIIITSFVIGGIFIYFLFTTIRHQKKILILSKLNIQAEVAAQEKERARIASDLHDELGPMISVAKMKINNFILHDETDKTELLRTNKLIDDAVTRIREIAFDLLPASLLRKGIVVALKQYINNLPKKTLTIYFTIQNNNCSLPDQVSITIYRMVQEIIQNTIKHAAATELKLNWDEIDNKIILTSRDNGKGFDYNKEIKRQEGLGLRNLISRVEMINGDFFIESKPGLGTRFQIEIPIE
ncbi:MAG TPA: sensor histidine kinase [Flavisolibacter sp.]|nr:sensor histidine kinase [Flavisolibacter sp.]